MPGRVSALLALIFAFSFAAAAPAARAQFPPPSLSMFSVDEAGDPAPDPAHCTNGVGGDCSLRDAVIAANATAGHDDIFVRVDPTLAIPPSSFDESSPATGDLDLTGSVSLWGPSGGTATIDASQVDRVFDVVTPGVTVNLIGLVLENGRVVAPASDQPAYTPVDGGAIRTTSSTTLRLISTTIRDSQAAGTGALNTAANGGAVAMGPSPDLTVRDSWIHGNSAGDSGGGLDLAGGGSAEIDHSTIDGNTARFGGGVRNASPLTVEHSTFHANSNTSNGGSAVGFEAAVTFRYSTIAHNDGNLDSGFRGPGSVSFEGSVLATSDADPVCNTDFGAGAYTSAGHNFLTQASGGCGITDGAGGDQAGESVSAMNLTGLVDNGGPTPTLLPQAGSSLIDQGGGCGGAHPTDQRYGKRQQGAACDVGAVEAGSLADLAILGWSAPAQATVGEDVTFAGAVANQGPDAADSVTVETFVPDDVEIRSATVGATPCSLGGGTLTCPVGALANGEQRSLTVVARQATTGSIALAPLAQNPMQGDWPAANSRGSAGTLIVAAPTATPPGGDGDPAPAPAPQPPAPGGELRVAAPPPVSISAASMLRRRFRVARGATPVVARARAPRGSAFRFTLSRAAAVTVRIERRLAGRRVGRACRRPARANRRRPRCVRHVAAGRALRRTGRPGPNRVRFTGRIGRRALAPGAYRATIRAAGATAPRRLAFTILPG